MQIAIALLVLVVIPNFWATWRVARSDLSLHRKTVGIFGVWLVPLIGANMVLRELRREELPRAAPTPIPLPRRRREPAPASVREPGLEPFEIREHLDEGAGAPILDFEALDAWAATATTRDAVSRARAEGRRVWLLHFRNWLGEQAELIESHDCWVLSPYSRGMAGAAARYMTESRRRIAQQLEGLAKFPEERGVIIAFDAEADYYDYIAKNYPAEGTFAPSVGMFINAGCPHIVTLRGDLGELEQAITHEMTHLGLAHLSLPLWLDEGLAVSIERRILLTHQHPAITPELLGKHQAFWTADTLQEFWSGKSFHRSDEGNRLSYELAQAVVESIGRERISLVTFASLARREDGGAAAARSALSRGLGELAATAVNMQPDAWWNPRPEAWDRISIKA